MKFGMPDDHNACGNWTIDVCVYEAEEELRLGEMVLSSGDSSITPTALEILKSTIDKMVSAAAAAGYRLNNEDQCASNGSIATVAAATAVYRSALNPKWLVMESPITSLNHVCYLCVNAQM